MHKINIELKARAAPARVGRALASVPAPVRLPNARLDMKMLDMKMLDMKLLDMKMLDMNIADSFVTSTYFAYPNRSDLIGLRVVRAFAKGQRPHPSPRATLPVALLCQTHLRQRVEFEFGYLSRRSVVTPS